MGYKYGSPQDFNGNELRNFRLQTLAGPPSTPGAGQPYYDSAQAGAFYWNGTAWVPMDARMATNIPISALAVDPRARTSHTGTQLANTISDLASAVQAYRLDQFAPPTAAVSFNGQRQTNVATPLAATDGVNKAYADSLVDVAVSGVISKTSVRGVFTTNVAALSGLPTNDGLTYVDGDRTLLTAQATQSQNGPWVVHAGAWTRPTTETHAELDLGAEWFVEQGAQNASTKWRLATPTSGAITPGTTAVTIVQNMAAQVYTPTAPITLVGNAFGLSIGSGLTTSGGALVADNATVLRKSVGVMTGTGAQTVFTITHNLNNPAPSVSIVDSSGNPWEVDWQATNANTVVVTWTTVPANGATFPYTISG